jgi:hypothetical protein
LSAAYRIFKWNKKSKETRRERDVAAKKIQKLCRQHALHMWMERRKAGADRVLTFIRMSQKEGGMLTMVQECVALLEHAASNARPRWWQRGS